MQFLIFVLVSGDCGLFSSNDIPYKEYQVRRAVKYFTHNIAFTFTSNLHAGASYLSIATCFINKSRPQSTKREAPFLNIFVSVCVSVLGQRGRRRRRGRDRRAGGCLDARRHVAVPLVETAQHLFAQTYQSYVYETTTRELMCQICVFIFRRLGSFQNICKGKLHVAIKCNDSLCRMNGILLPKLQLKHFEREQVY